MEIRIAGTERERELIFRFRYAIYIDEMRKPISCADHTRKLLRDDLDDQATHVYATRGTDLVAALRINWGRHESIPARLRDWYRLDRFDEFPSSVLSFTSRMMIAQGYRKSPAAAALASEAYSLGRQNKIEFDFIHTEPALVPFFLRLGHRPYKDDFSDPDLGNRTPLVLVLRDIDHLRACGSPFIKHLNGDSSSPDTGEWFRNTFHSSRDLMMP